MARTRRAALWLLVGCASGFDGITRRLPSVPTQRQTLHGHGERPHHPRSPGTWPTASGADGPPSGFAGSTAATATRMATGGGDGGGTDSADRLLPAGYLASGLCTAVVWAWCAYGSLATYKPHRITHNSIGVAQALTVLPLIWSVTATLAKSCAAASGGRSGLRSPECRRLNLGMAGERRHGGRVGRPTRELEVYLLVSNTTEALTYIRPLSSLDRTGSAATAPPRWLAWQRRRHGPLSRRTGRPYSPRRRSGRATP